MPEKKLNYLIGLVVICLTLVIFRFPIFSQLGLNNWVRITLAIPLISLFYVWLWKTDFSFDIVDFLFLSIFFVGMGFMISSVASGNMTAPEVFSKFASFFLFALFPFFVRNLSLTRIQLGQCVFLVALVVVFAGGFQLMWEGFQFSQGKGWVDLYSRYYSSASDEWIRGGYFATRYSNIRATGFFLNPSQSAYLLGACGVLVLSWPDPKIIVLRIAAFLVALMGIMASGSLLPTATIILFGFLILLQTMSGRSRLWFIGVSAAIFGGYFVVVPYNSLTERIVVYIRNPQLIRTFSANFSDCAQLPVWGPAGKQFCNFHEFHFSYLFFESGFLGSLPWYLFVFSPLLVAPFWKKLDGMDKSVLFGAMFLFSSGIHYSAFEAWGINYFYGLLVVFLFAKKSASVLI